MKYSFESWTASKIRLFSGWGPYAYFRAMEESRASSNINQDSPAGQGMDDRVMNQEPRRNGNTFTPYSYRSPTLEAMEMGMEMGHK